MSPRPSPPALAELFALEADLSEAQRMVRDSVRAFSRQVFLPRVQQAFRDETFPDDLIPKLGALGVLGGHLEGYGCAGMDATSYGLAMRELEWVDSGLRSFCSVQGALCMDPIWRFGSEDQRQRFLPQMAAGTLVGCFGLTEPGSGSDPASMSTRARPVPGGWRLTGTKQWITNAPIAGLALVWAKIADGDAASIRGFLVQRGAAGFETPTLRHKLSLRASWTGEIVLDDCFVPAEDVLPGVVGLKGPLSCLTQARYGIAWGALGAGLACYEAALAYSLEREQFGRPLASFQLSQAKLTEMATALVTGHLLAAHLAALKDRGALTPTQVSLAKRHNCAAALDIARSARSLLGANGITDAWPVMRHAMNLESVFTYEGTHEIHTLAVGRALTGHSAFA